MVIETVASFVPPPYSDDGDEDDELSSLPELLESDDEDEGDDEGPVVVLDNDDEERVEPWEDPNVEDIPEITDPEMPLPEGELFEATIAYNSILLESVRFSRDRNSRISSRIQVVL